MALIAIVQNCACARGIVKCASDEFAVQRLQCVNAARLQRGCVGLCIEDGPQCPLKDWGGGVLELSAQQFD